MIEVAKAISIFGLSQDHAPPDDQLILTRGQLREIIQEAIQPLLERIETLENKVDELQALQELFHGPAPDPLEREMVRDALNRQKDVQSTLPIRVSELEERVEQRTPSAPLAKGSKTEARITKLREILKRKGGACSFKTLRKELGLKANQFTALTKALDGRVFLVTVDHRARDEKILRLRAFT